MSAEIIRLANFSPEQEKSWQPSEWHYDVKQTPEFPGYVNWFCGTAGQILRLRGEYENFDINYRRISDDAERVALMTKYPSASLSRARDLIEAEINPKPWSFIRTIPVRATSPEVYAAQADKWLSEKKWLPGSNTLVRGIDYQYEIGQDSVTFKFNRQSHAKHFGGDAALREWQLEAVVAANRQGPIISLDKVRQAAEARRARVNSSSPVIR